MSNLSPKELELLAMLAEEASEVTQAVTKIIRHGYDSRNPNDLASSTNREHLADEVYDFLAVAYMAIDAGIIPDKKVTLQSVIDRKKIYMHHG